MTSLFRLSNLIVLPLWGLMIFLPRWHWTARIMRSPFVIAILAAIYAALVLPRVSGIWPAVSLPTLSGVANLLASPEGATIAWIHLLAFDLFVGRWIYFDSDERRFSRWLMAPILFFTLMLGPIGLLLYLITRMAANPSKNTAPAVPSGRESLNEQLPGAISHRSRVHDLLSLLRGAARVNRPLTIAGLAMLLVFIATLAGLLFDRRVITGAPAWLKPAKFALSTSIYCFTLLWLLGFVKNGLRFTRFAANVTAGSLVVEIAIIVAQAARGTTSHFNLTTPLNSLLWIAMGAFIVLVWTMNLVVTVLLVRQRMPDRAFGWSLRLGLFISLVGMASGFLMVRPTPEQIAAAQAGHNTQGVGAHTVGIADGGPGLPVLGWSTVGGDLRVAHFVGLHALQILPFLGWILTRRRGLTLSLPEAHRSALVWTSASAYQGFVLLLTWQALRGQSVVHPDAKTLATASILTFFAAGSILLTISKARRANRSKSVFCLGEIDPNQNPPRVINS
jgi:hypothetical protein